MISATTLVKAKTEKILLSSAEYHKKAANWHFEAAKHHSVAAKHHETGNHNEACKYPLKAYWYHCLASQAEKEDVKYAVGVSQP
jgi:hypothetical protein